MNTEELISITIVTEDFLYMILDIFKVSILAGFGFVTFVLWKKRKQWCWLVFCVAVAIPLLTFLGFIIYQTVFLGDNLPFKFANIKELALHGSGALGFLIALVGCFGFILCKKRKSV